MGGIKYFYKYIFIVIFALCAIYFISCKSSKKISKSIPPTGSIEVFNQYSEKYDFITDNAFSFDWLSAKVSLKSENLPVNLNGQLRMRKDSVIWLSVSMLVEAARMKLTPDSVYFYNKFENEYYIGGYSFLQNFFGMEVDFNIVQALFTGNDVPMNGKLAYTSYRHPEDTSKVVYQFKDRILSKKNRLKAGRQYMEVYLANGRIGSIVYTFLPQQMDFYATYSKYIATERGYFPAEQTFIIKYPNDKADGIELIFEKPVLDSPLSFPFNISNKAKPISF